MNEDGYFSDPFEFCRDVNDSWECFSLMQHETITVQVRALIEFRALRRNGRAAPLLAERETLVSTPT